MRLARWIIQTINQRMNIWQSKSSRDNNISRRPLDKETSFDKTYDVWSRVLILQSGSASIGNGINISRKTPRRLSLVSYIYRMSSPDCLIVGRRPKTSTPINVSDYPLFRNRPDIVTYVSLWTLWNWHQTRFSQWQLENYQSIDLLIELRENEY